MHRKLRPKIKISCRQPSSYTCHSLEGRRLHTSQTKSVLPHDATKYTEVYFRKKYQNTQNNAPKRYAHTVGNRCDSAKCCVAAVYTYKYNINTILSRAIQQRYSQFEGLRKKAGSRDRTAGLTSRTRLVRSTLPASNLTQIHYICMKRDDYITWNYSIWIKVCYRFENKKYVINSLHAHQSCFHTVHQVDSLKVITRGQLWPSGIVVACIYVCVCVRVCMCVCPSITTLSG